MPQLHRPSRLGALLLWAAFSSGLLSCGYRMGATGSGACAELRTVSVPLFANESLEPRLEDVLTQAFRDRFSASGLKLGSADAAEAVLRGTVRSVVVTPVAVNEDFLAMEYMAHVAVSFSLQRKSDGKVLWRADRVEEETRFYASSDALLFRDNREEALLRLSRKMSDRVVDQILFGF
ncbi:MAG: LptE family protein [bacterium]